MSTEYIECLAWNFSKPYNRKLAITEAVANLRRQAAEDLRYLRHQEILRRVCYEDVEAVLSTQRISKPYLDDKLCCLGPEDWTWFSDALAVYYNVQLF